MKITVYTVYAEGDQYVSLCNDPPVSSCGDTLDEALANLLDAIDVYTATVAEIQASATEQ